MSGQAVEREAFIELVRQALGQIHNRVLLQVHPLCALFSQRSATSAAEELQQALLDAVRQLRPAQVGAQSTAQWRRFRYLWLRYVEGVRLEQIAESLGVSDRQARRDHRDALEAVAAILWTRCHKTPWPADRDGVGYETSQSGEDEECAALEAELSKLDSALGHGPTSLSETLEGTLETASRLIEGRQLRLAVATQPDLPPVAVSQLILRQILLSLLAHAVGHASGGQIRLTASGGPDGAMLSIATAGSAGRSGTPSGALAGQGVPLELARRLVEREGGSLIECSDDAGRGELIIRLPAARLVTVLVVDDNLDFLRLCQRYLEGSAYRPLTASIAAEALRLAREAQPDVILLDVLMPTQDGWELLRRLQRDELTRHIPVIVCSVMREPTLALDLGAAGFLPKPVTRLSLQAALERLQAGRRADRGSPAGTS